MLELLGQTVYVFMSMPRKSDIHTFIQHSFNLYSYFIYLYTLLNELNIYIITVPYKWIIGLYTYNKFEKDPLNTHHLK
jgi:hypothetical protein